MVIGTIESGDWFVIDKRQLFIVKHSDKVPGERRVFIRGLVPVMTVYIEITLDKMDAGELI